MSRLADTDDETSSERKKMDVVAMRRGSRHALGENSTTQTASAPRIIRYHAPNAAS